MRVPSVIRGQSTATRVFDVDSLTPCPITGAEKIDYVHGGDVTVRLGSQPGNAGVYLPGMAKGDLFKTVILDGALPRKTFSMGEAADKRFYMEARQIV